MAAGSAVLELFGECTGRDKGVPWRGLVAKQRCPFTRTRCFKVRKSEPDIAIGTCTVRHGKVGRATIICPNRFLERRQVFTDCLHLLAVHEPGNELHLVPEVSVPGGSIDYFLVSARRGKVHDFAAIEFQALDTTGSVWPERQRLLHAVGLNVPLADIDQTKAFGLNWKMTAKTILMQLHHKAGTFEHIGKRLVVVLQDHLLSYLRQQFRFDHVADARLGDAVHIHAYSLDASRQGLSLELQERSSTDAAGVARCLGIQAETRVDLQAITEDLERKISPNTRFTVRGAPLRSVGQLPSE